MKKCTSEAFVSGNEKLSQELKEENTKDAINKY